MSPSGIKWFKFTLHCSCEYGHTEKQNKIFYLSSGNKFQNYEPAEFQFQK